jgi:hypothetical protein
MRGIVPSMIFKKSDSVTHLIQEEESILLSQMSIESMEKSDKDPLNELTRIVGGVRPIGLMLDDEVDRNGTKSFMTR